MKILMKEKEERKMGMKKKERRIEEKEEKKEMRKWRGRRMRSEKISFLGNPEFLRYGAL